MATGRGPLCPLAAARLIFDRDVARDAVFAAGTDIGIHTVALKSTAVSEVAVASSEQSRVAIAKLASNNAIGKAETDNVALVTVGTVAGSDVALAVISEAAPILVRPAM